MLIDSVIFDRRTWKILPPRRPTTAQIDDNLIELPPLRQKIWRYMAYEKFEDFLKSRRLYCRRLDRLPDGLEALLSTGNFRQRTAVAQALHNGYKIQENHDQEIFQSQWMRQLYFVNCWNINDSESRAMWRLYAPYAESVVVISRVAMLRAYAASCLHWGLGRALISKIKYVDFDYPRPDWVSWGPALFKDLTYRFEREIRLIATPALPMERIPDSEFWKIPVDTASLIEKIILHPHADLSFQRSVSQLVRRHLPGVSVVTSEIAGRLW